MFLVLGSPTNYWLSAACRYLACRAEPFLFLEAQSLINELQVDDTIDAGQALVKWDIRGTICTSLNVVGVLNFLDDLSLDLFEDFEEEDRAYALAEWHAYLLFAISQFKNCCNPSWGGSLSGFTNSLPFQWNLLQRAEIQSVIVPRHYFGLREDVPIDFRRASNLVVSSSPYSYRHWNTDHTIDIDPHSLYLFYERPRGRPIVVSAIDQALFATDVLSNCAVHIDDLPVDVAHLIHYLMNFFGLRIAEVLLFFDKERKRVCFGSISSGLSFCEMEAASETDIIAALAASIGAI